MKNNLRYADSRRTCTKFKKERLLDIVYIAYKFCDVTTWFLNLLGFVLLDISM